MHRYKIFIEYQGTEFSGWQKQHNAITVQECIEKALFQLCQQTANVYAAGRTDAGVHAIAMPAHFDLPKYYDPIRVQHALNFFLKEKAISIFNVEYLGEKSDFHSRFSAIERTYVYKIIKRNYPLTWQNQLYWWITYDINLQNMQSAANLLLGTHDFSTFRAQGCQANSPIRTINKIEIKHHSNENTDEYHIKIAAPSFLYHQVRNIVGSLYYVGINKWTIYDFKYAFEQKNRTLGGPTAPAFGLYFYNARYKT